MPIERIGLSWPLNGNTGWGIFGLNLTLELLHQGPPLPLLVAAPETSHFTPQQLQMLAQPIREQQNLLQQIQAHGGGLVATLNEVLMLHALGNKFVWGKTSSNIQGRYNVGFIFFEETSLDDSALERARKFDRILVGSSWNEEVLNRHGLDHVAKVLQGIDDAVFFPRPRTMAYGDRFVIFSGGKLEPRKAQDLVLAAFQKFHQKHPDALLVTAWQNHWIEFVNQMTLSPHVKGAPKEQTNGTIAISDWAEANGIPSDAFVDLGWVNHAQLPDILCEAHVALFPNRCEGGTNLAAMEAMACGIPCILSANTGHMDLIEDDNCYPLRDQTAVTFGKDFPEDWRESSIDEILEALEQAYQNRGDAMARGQKAADFMKKLTWRRQTGILLETLADLT